MPIFETVMGGLVALLAVAIPIIGILATFLVIGWIAWLWYQRRQRETTLRKEMYDKFLDRFASAEDLRAFLQTEEGRQFLQRLGREFDPTDRLIRMLRTGLVATLMGIGLLVLGFWKPFYEPGFVFLAVILGAIGIGSLVTVWIARQWILQQATYSQNRGSQSSSDT